MGGELKYVLTLEGSQFTKTAEAATKTVASQTAALAGVNAAMNDKAALTAGQLKSNARALSGVLTNLTMTASVFAGPEVSSVLYPLMIVGKEMKGLAASMKLVGITAPIAALGLAGLAGVIAIGTEGFKFAKAAQTERDTRTATRETLGGINEKLWDQVRHALARGKIGNEEAQKLWLSLNVTTSSEAELYAKIHKIQMRLREALGAKIDLAALTDLGFFQEGLEAQTLTGKARAKKELDIEAVKLFQEGDKMAAAAGISNASITATIKKYLEAKNSQIDKDFETPRTTTQRPEVTSLEKIGFVRNFGLGQGDFQASIAENTRKTWSTLDQTNLLLKQITPTNFRDVGDFSNQA